MPQMVLHNTLTGKKEPFVPLAPGEVRMYTCGPTVYDFAHIGNYTHSYSRTSCGGFCAAGDSGCSM